MTVDELLGYQRPLQRIVGRRAAERVCARLLTGQSLVQIALAALDERPFRRAAMLAAADTTAREREAIAIADREMEIICAARAAHATRLPAAGLSPVTTDDLLTLLMRMAADPSWRLVEAGFDALSAEAAGGRLLPEALLSQARTLAVADDQPVWSQVAALRFLAVALGARASVLLQSRLGPCAAPDDMFVRAEAARLLANVDPVAAAHELAELPADPSEYVRIEHCAILGGLGHRPALERRLDPGTEPSPRVRAAAAIALGALAPERLVAVMNDDPDEIARRAALEEAEPHLPDSPALQEATMRLAATAPWPALRRLAAEALERTHHRTDRDAAAALRLLRGAAESTAAAGRIDVVTDCPAPHLGRALAALSCQDHGLTLEQRAGNRWRLFRGDRSGWRLWRMIHELCSPSGEKRQSHRHTVGRITRGELRAGSGIMAEVSPTNVPGQRVVGGASGDWGRHLPCVDDLLGRPAAGRALIFSSFGVTTIDYPARSRWPGTVLRLHRDFTALAHLRQRSLEALEAKDRRAYVDALVDRGFVISFTSYRADGPADIVELFRGEAAPFTGAGSAGDGADAGVSLAVVPLFDVVTQSLQQPRPAAHLLAAGVAALGLMVARLYESRREIARARARIPLSIGGWGTRGKSGTERLKAALFQGLGCRVLAKTTGCEAVVLHAIPDVRAEEIFVYRPYDKATIWEQRDIVRLAAKLDVDVLLWECMALNPAYVEILQGAWMHDDLCTLTNAYPDHENIQGPSGVDVARALSQFIPQGRTLLTAEEQMLPILRDVAAARGSQLIPIGWRDHALLPADLLARFPYREHPRNIALVVRLAESFGISPAVALKEMADWIVPDLGVLKTYPDAPWRSRRLSFSNGMSANERTGFLGNWSRLGFDQMDDPPGQWIVTVVNNRADRVSRSAVFADILVRDIAAHRHVLIGTNLGGFKKFVGDALAAFTRAMTLFDRSESTLPPAERGRRAVERATRFLRRLKLGPLGEERLAREAQAIARGVRSADVDDPDIHPQLFLEALGKVGEGGGLASTRAALRPLLAASLRRYLERLGPAAEDALQHLVSLTASHAVLLGWQATLHRAVADAQGPASLEKEFERLQTQFRVIYTQLFLSSLVTVDAAQASGDQVIDRIALCAPPGFRVRIMGAQNIKGTGLDFAYRWLAFDETHRFAALFSGADAARQVTLAESFLARTDLGVLDHARAARVVRDAASRAEGPAAERLRGLAAAIEERLRHSESRLRRPDLRPSRWRAAIRQLGDVFEGVLRRRRADRIFGALGARRISQTTAAAAMRALTTRPPGVSPTRDKIA